MSTQWVDFKEVKAAVSIEMALGHYSVELRKVNGATLRGACPLPSHVGESTTSFCVNLDKNAWACHAGSCVAERSGRKGGNVLDFVAEMEGCSVRDAALKLQDWFSVDASSEKPPDYVPSRHRKKPDKKLVTEKKEEGTGNPENSPRAVPTARVTHRGHDDSDDEQCTTSRCTAQSARDDDDDKRGHHDEQEHRDDGPVNVPLGFTLKSIDPSHEYFTRRGIRKETCQHFGVGYFYGKGSMAGRAVIPVHDEFGELIAYAGRALDDTQPKYKVPAGFKKSLVLFNLHRVLESESREVIVCEGFFDSMKVFQAGFSDVVALMGSAMSDYQEKLLVQNFDRVVIMLDNDKAGDYAATQLVARLMDKVFVRIVRVPDGKQPDQLSSEEIRTLLTFLHSER